MTTTTFNQDMAVSTDKIVKDNPVAVTQHRMKLATLSRILIAVASLAVVACFFVPIWVINLWAPQYPEGLTMYIWHNDLSGDVQIINGLNHYIGMKTIEVDMFPEFKSLGIFIAIYILLGLLVSITGSFRMLVSYFVADIVFACAALIDFYRWGYDYGHNLSPDAAIQVPGMSYQPPVLGYKTLLNFEAYSGPYIGGWIVVGVGVITFLLLVFEWRKRRRHNKMMPHVFTIASLFLLISFSACSQNAEPIKYGKDHCNYCEMTIMKNNAGGELITKKGKIFKFDDAWCLHDFIADQKVKTSEISKVYFNDFELNQLIEAGQLALVKNENYKTPMASGIIAVKKESSKKYLDEPGSISIDFNSWLGR